MAETQKNLDKINNSSSIPSTIDLSKVNPEFAKSCEAENLQCQLEYQTNKEIEQYKTNIEKQKIIDEVNNQNIETIIKPLNYLKKYDWYKFIELLQKTESNWWLSQNIKNDLFVIFENAWETNIRFCLDDYGNISDKNSAIDFIKNIKPLNIFKAKIDWLLKTDINKLNQEEQNKYISNTKDFLHKYWEYISSDDKITVEKQQSTVEKQQAITKAQDFTKNINELDLSILPLDIKNDLEYFRDFDFSNWDTEKLEEHQQKAKELVQKLLDNPELFQEVYDKIPENKREVFFENLSAIVETQNPSLASSLRLKIQSSKNIWEFKTTHIPVEWVGLNTKKEAVMNTSWNYQIPLNYDKKTSEVLSSPIKAVWNKERQEFTKLNIEIKTEINSLQTIIKLKSQLLILEQNPEKNKENINYLKTQIQTFSPELQNKNIADIQKVLEQKKEYLEFVTQKFNELIQKNFKQYSDKAKEKEQQAKEIKDFFDRSWFSVFPNNIMDLMMIEVNKTLNNIDGVSLHSKVDLSKWEFWQWINDSQIEWQKIFLKLFNKMISWQSTEPITNINAIAENRDNSLRDNTKMIWMLLKNGIDINKWIALVETMKENLKKKEGEEKEN